MKMILGLILFSSLNAHAGLKVECVAGNLRFTVEGQSTNLRISYKGETVEADGILSTDEVDLVAKFSSIGEMTLFAKVGRNEPGNYIFTQGQRFSVVCR